MINNNTPAGKIKHTGSQIVEPAFKSQNPATSKVKKGDDLRSTNQNVKPIGGNKQ